MEYSDTICCLVLSTITELTFTLQNIYYSEKRGNLPVYRLLGKTKHCFVPTPLFSYCKNYKLKLK